MKYNNKKSLACFYIMTFPSVKISVSFLDPNDDFKEMQNLQDKKFTEIVSCNFIDYIKTVANEDKTKTFLCFTCNYNVAYCYVFNMIKNKFSYYVSTSNCLNNTMSEKVYFFGNTFLFVCNDLSSSSFHFIITDENLEYNTNDDVVKKYDYNDYINSQIYSYNKNSTTSIIFTNKFLLVSDALYDDDSTKTKILELPDDF